MIKVAANNASNLVHTIDEHGLVERNMVDLIMHIANRYATLNGGKFFFDVRREKAI